jgi:hypothetical protein
LIQYQKEYDPIEGLYYDPVAFPMSPYRQGCATWNQEVDAYNFPVLLYDKILYVEKGCGPSCSRCASLSATIWRWWQQKDTPPRLLERSFKR